MASFHPNENCLFGAEAQKACFHTQNFEMMSQALIFFIFL